MVELASRHQPHHLLLPIPRRPGTRRRCRDPMRAASPTWRAWSKRSCSTVSGCSSLASGSCTVHHSFLWHWRPEVKRDLERRGRGGGIGQRVAPGCDTRQGTTVCSLRHQYASLPQGIDDGAHNAFVILALRLGRTSL